MKRQTFVWSLIAFALAYSALACGAPAGPSVKRMQVVMPEAGIEVIGV